MHRGYVLTNLEMDSVVAVNVKNKNFDLLPIDSRSTLNKSICFTNVCTIKKAVTKLFTDVNFECEDCDDSDIEKALLAKSLLETIKNME